jgi:hypothetical protein
MFNYEGYFTHSTSPILPGDPPGATGSRFPGIRIETNRGTIETSNGQITIRQGTGGQPVPNLQPGSPINIFGENSWMWLIVLAIVAFVLFR